MAKVEWEVGSHKDEIDYQKGTLLPSVEPLADLIRTLQLLDSVLGISEFVFERVASESYEYRFDSSDGREWRQTINIPANRQASMDFAVSDFFTPVEVAPHRAVRSIVIFMARTFGVSRVSIEGNIP